MKNCFIGLFLLYTFLFRIGKQENRTEFDVSVHSSLLPFCYLLVYVGGGRITTLLFDHETGNIKQESETCTRYQINVIKIRTKLVRVTSNN